MRTRIMPRPRNGASPTRPRTPTATRKAWYARSPIICRRACPWDRENSGTTSNQKLPDLSRRRISSCREELPRPDQGGSAPVPLVRVFYQPGISGRGKRRCRRLQRGRRTVSESEAVASCRQMACLEQVCRGRTGGSRTAWWPVPSYMAARASDNASQHNNTQRRRAG